MAEIPKDIIETKILHKIPPENLANFKLVCKSFNSVISSPKFINGRLIIVNTTGEGIHVFDFDSLNSLPFFLPFPVNFISESSSTDPNFGIFNLGSCNGLICFGNVVSKKLLLLNPFTGMFFDVPPFLPLEKGLHFIMHYVGFGFDDLSNDYKIFALVSGYRRRDVMLFSLRDNSWKLVLSSSFRGSLYGKGVVIDNHLLHWVCTDKDMEAFGGKHTKVDMWVMKEYGVNDSWVKVLGGVSDFSVTSTLRMCPLGSRYGSIVDPDPQQEILLARGHKHTKVFTERVLLIWYNIKDKKCRLSQVHKLHGFAHHFYDASTCTKSLVSLPGGSRIPKEKRTVP